MSLNEKFMGVMKIISFTKWQQICWLMDLERSFEITIDWFNDPDNLKLYGANYEI